MTTAGGAPPKYLRVAAAVRRQIADGALRPGQPAPSGAELSRASGFSTLTCRKALKTLIADGLLVPGPSRNARPRVADPHAAAIERDLADTARALSAGLAARRHAAGLTQAELAALARVSVTTVGHAETGRTWQSRRFWERADAALHADGELLRLHDNFRAASSPQHHQRSTAASIERTLSSTPPDHAPVTASDRAAASHPDDENGTAPVAPLGVSPAAIGPARIVIVWTDGSITTVHPPEVHPAPQAAAAPSAFPQATAPQVVTPLPSAAQTERPTDQHHPASANH